MRYPTHHRLFLLVFLLGVVLSAIFTVIEYRWISKDYDEERYLRKAYAAKAIIAGVLIVLAIAFAVAMFHSYDVGAILEWVIAFGFTSYIITFYFDLRQSKNMRKGEFSATLLPEEAEGSRRPQYKLVRMAEV
ncbi:hypothetical protein ONZ45_g11319 [Pleurotus djamor]|nr:hypothetical protein ONZ45_g11319 [Pleurotus djamor]